MKHTDVIIVGAGLSGLSAALELQRRGLDVIVLEAQNRIGGRVLSIKTENGSIIELGGQWVSPLQSRMQRLIKRYGLTLVNAHHNGKTIYDILGRRRTANDGTSAIPKAGLLDLMLLQRKINHLLKHLSASSPWTSPIALSLDKQTMETWLRRNMFTKSGYAYCKNVIEEISCSRLYEFSALDALWCLKTIGSVSSLLTAEQQWIEEGALTLAERMGQTLRDSISLASPVSHIQYSQHEVHVHTDNGNWRGKRVILALPPALAGRIHYDPPLSANRDQLMQRSGQSSVIKCIAVYDTPFWREAGYNGTAYLDGHTITFTIDSSTPKAGEGVLTTFISGSKARRLSQEPERRKAEVLRDLGALFGPASAHPTYYFEKNWSDDPWARGGYSAHYGTGFLTEFGRCLLKPHGPIHWAGTETSTEWRTYMEGALQSGERAALEVAAVLSKKKGENV